MSDEIIVRIRKMDCQENIAPRSLSEDVLTRKTITFYYHQQDNYILSNFYPHVPGKKLKSRNILYAGKSFPTSEHLYQALKFRWETPEEIEWLELIRTASTPGIAKHLGHQQQARRWKWQQNATELVNKYRDKVRLAGSVTDDVFRLSIMRTAVRARFECDKEFAAALAATYPHKLMEDSDDDWGRRKGWLGTVLEEVRDKAREEHILR